MRTDAIAYAYPLREANDIGRQTGLRIDVGLRYIVVPNSYIMAQGEYQAIRFKDGGGKASECLELQHLSIEQPGPGDLLVKIMASAVNPVDTKIRSGAIPAANITGYDAAGVVQAVGSNVPADKFKVGDEVFYMGVLKRSGTMAQYHLIDHRMVALRPKALDWVHAAGVPLVSLTAWELFVDGFNLRENRDFSDKTIIIVNGAGGVGSIATQLARRVFKFGRVVVTASRPETVDWVKKMGATHVLDHQKPLLDQLEPVAGTKTCDYFMICHLTPQYLPQAVALCAPGGQIGSIVEAGTGERLPGLEAMDAFFKSLAFRWEMVLGKSYFDHNVQSQGDMLKRIAELYDEGKLESIVTSHAALSVAGLVRAHEQLESGKAIGKIAFTVGSDLA